MTEQQRNVSQLPSGIPGIVLLSGSVLRLRRLRALDGPGTIIANEIQLLVKHAEQAVDEAHMLADAYNEQRAYECEFCGETIVPYLITGDMSGDSYAVCANCHIALVMVCLSPKQYLRAKDHGGDVNRFYLHDDFYTEFGEALQPKMPVQG